MNTQLKKFRWIFRTILVVIFSVMPLMTGCQKKCPISSERQSSVTSTPWRLVETNDPEYQQYINPDTQQFTFTFLVWSFSQTFSGDIKLVQNNTQYDSPVRTFVFDINPRQNQMLIKFAIPGSGDSSTQSSGSQNQGNAPVFYMYDLSNTLKMYSQQGYEYRFVPFTGILSPDDTCVF